MEQETRIAIIGTGSVGGNLGARFLAAGLPVRFGLRDLAKRDELLARIPNANVCTTSEAAEWANVIVMAVPGTAVVVAAAALGNLDDKIVVDCTNPLRWDEGPVWTPPPEGSNAAALATRLPGAHIVKAFNTFGAELHDDPDLSAGPVDVQLAGEPAAKARVAEIASRAGFETIDAGPLRNAALLENLAILWIHLATVGGHGREKGFKLLSRSE